jgi:polyhydroxybutyrate depolymerase
VKWSLPLVLFCACAAAERPDGSVELDDGYYVLRTPSDWNGRDPLPAFVHLHGWKGSPDKYLKNDRLLQDFAEGPAVVAFPDGEGNWYTGQANPKGRRDDQAFLAAVAADLRQRVNVSAVFLSGHSTGASMVYAVACHGSGEYDGYLPISGGFWTPLPTACAGPARPVMHLHGADDTVWEMDGGGWGAQGGARESLGALRDAWRCGGATAASTLSGGRECTTWTGCDAALCVRPEGQHKLPTGWGAWHADWGYRVVGEE